MARLKLVKMPKNFRLTRPIGLLRVHSQFALAAGVFLFLGALWYEAKAAFADEPDTLVVKLVHPERQSAAILKLFDGTRAKHPAAALASWKGTAGPSRDLGKPVEALIALFNPEMAAEWRVMHGAQVTVNWDAARSRPAWCAIVPGDNGTLAAAIAAARLSDGASEAPLDLGGSQIAVERLGRPGASLAACAGTTLIFGSSRDELLRAAKSSSKSANARLTATDGGRAAHAMPASADKPIDSGVSFILDASRLASEPSLPQPARATAELLRGLGCQLLEGSVALNGDCLGLDVRTLLQAEDRAGAALWNGMAPIDPAWFLSVPRSGTMAVVAMAFRPSRAFWDSAFALADRVEKTHPRTRSTGSAANAYEPPGTDRRRERRGRPLAAPQRVDRGDSGRAEPSGSPRRRLGRLAP